MKKLFAVAFITSALVACGGSKKASTTPDNKASEMKSGATGGQTYGGAAGGAMPGAGAGAAGSGSTGKTSDPCAGGK